MMHLMSQTMRPLENVGPSMDDLRTSWDVMALSDSYNDVRMFIFPKCQVRGPHHC